MGVRVMKEGEGEGVWMMRTFESVFDDDDGY
jgi:hypothetical protein